MKKADEVRQLYDSSNIASRQKWLSNFSLCRDFVNNDQLTAEELESLHEQGMPDFVINMVRPAVEVVKYFATANNPRWRAVGVEESDVDVAEVHEALIAWRWNQCKGQSIYSTVIDNALVGGLGLFHIYVDPNQDNGKGEVVFEAPDPMEFFIDPKASDPLFRNALYMGFRKVFTRSSLMMMYPEYKRKIQAAASSMSGEESYSGRDEDESMTILPEDIQEGIDQSGEEDDLIDFYLVYYKDMIPYYNVFYRVFMDMEKLNEARRKMEEELESLRKELTVQLEELRVANDAQVKAGNMLPERKQLEEENFVKQANATIEEYRQQFEAEINESLSRIENSVVTESEYKALLEDEGFQEVFVDAVRFNQPRIRYRIVAGDKLLEEDYLSSKITEYPVVPVMYIHTGTPYPMSFVSMLIGKQRELNKSHQITIHNANLASNLRWLLKEGTVDLDFWERYSSSSGALLTWRGEVRPEPILPLPLNNAFYTLTMESKQDFWDLAGIYPHQQGDISLQHDMPHKGILAVDEFGTRRVRSWMKNSVEVSLQHLGEVFKQFCQATYTSHKIFRIVQPSALSDDERNPKFQEYEINVPVYRDQSTAIAKAMNYAEAKFDVMIVPGSTEPVNRWAKRAEFFDYYRSGAIDDIAFILNSDIPGKNDIIKRNSMYMKMMNQINQLEEELKSKNGDIETLHRQLMQMGIRDKIRQAGVEVERQKARTGAAEVVTRKELEIVLNSTKNELKNAIRNFKKELELIKKKEKQKEGE